ncbi:hypothetical protein RHECNPAF_9300139 [Rhizobium etli CNPAF512]|nr:hypothetical protein RHECNPAF_9300139 [Rhizobium etli CNPAF512]
MRSLSPRQHAPQVGTGAAGSDLFKAWDVSVHVNWLRLLLHEAI